MVFDYEQFSSMDEDEEEKKAEVGAHLNSQQKSQMHKLGQANERRPFPELIAKADFPDSDHDDDVEDGSEGIDEGFL